MRSHGPSEFYGDRYQRLLYGDEVNWIQSRDVAIEMNETELRRRDIV